MQQCHPFPLCSSHAGLPLALPPVSVFLTPSWFAFPRSSGWRPACHSAGVLLLWSLESGSISFWLSWLISHHCAWCWHACLSPLWARTFWKSSQSRSGAQCPVLFSWDLWGEVLCKDREGAPAASPACPGRMVGSPGLGVRQAEAGNHEAPSGSRGSFSVLVLLSWAFRFRS